MKIDVYCASFCKNNGKPDQNAAAGIILDATEEDHRFKRQFGVPFGDINSYLADVKSARFALSCIMGRFRSEFVCFHISSANLERVLRRNSDGFVMNPKKFEDDIDKLRKLYEQYPKIKLVNEDNEVLLKARDLAINAVELQELYDSG
jgi:hypothetical protein